MKKTKKLYLLVINLFIVLTILALAGTAYLTLATANISVPGEQERFTGSSSIDITKDGSDQSLTGTIVSHEYTLSESFPVGATTSTSKKAGGTVTIVNNYNRSQNLVRTTRLMTSDGKIFRITDAVTVPVGGKVTVFAEADQEGDAYLIGPSKFTIPGLWEGVQDKIYAESSSPMSYDRNGVAQVTQDVVDKAKDSLTDKLLTQALADFQKENPDLQNLAREQLFSRTSTITSDPAVGAQASAITVTITKTISAVDTDSTKLQDALKAKLIAQLPDPNSFIELIPDTLTYTIAALDPVTGVVQLDTKIDAWIHSKSTAPDLDLSKITGKTKSQALDYLHQAGATEAIISTFPSWAPTLPLLKDHITLQVK